MVGAAAVEPTEWAESESESESVESTESESESESEAAAAAGEQRPKGKRKPSRKQKAAEAALREAELAQMDAKAKNSEGVLKVSFGNWNCWSS